MKVNFALADFGAAFFSAIALSDTPPQPPVPPAPPQAETVPAPVEAPKEDKVVCKKYKTTGSRLATEKVCKKQSEWDLEAEEARRATDRAVGAQTPSAPMGGQ